MSDPTEQTGDDQAEAKPAGKQPRRARATAPSGGGGEIKRLSIAVIVGVQLVCVLLLFALINFLSYRHYHRADLSAAGSYSISEDTEGYLSRLDTEVTLTMAFMSSSKVRDQLKALLEEYRRLGDGQVTLEEFDPVRDKARAQEVKDRYKMSIDQNTVFVEVGGKVKRVTEQDMLIDNGTQFAGEAAITSAMLAATEGRPKTVYLIAGKGKLREANRRTALEELIDLSARQFFTLKELTLGNITSIPEDADALLLINPETDFSAPEMDMVERYWEDDNGSLVLLTNPETPMPNLYAFLRKRGVWVRNTHRVLFSQVLGIGGAQKIYGVQAKLLDGSPITTANSGAITTLGGSTCPLMVAENNTGLAAEGIVAKALLEADPKFWGDLDHIEENPTVGPDDIKPPVYIAASVERARGGVGADGVQLLDSSRLVVVGNSTLLDSDHITRTNEELVMNSLNWTLDREERLNITPRAVVKNRIDLPASKYRNIFLLVVFLLPGAAFCFAVFVWSSRRN